MDLETVVTYGAFVGIAGGALILYVRNGLPGHIKRNVDQSLKEGDGNGTPAPIKLLIDMSKSLGEVSQQLKDDKDERLRYQEQDRVDTEARQIELNRKLEGISECLSDLEKHKEHTDERLNIIEGHLGISPEKVKSLTN
jgi:hypothetical protein